MSGGWTDLMAKRQDITGQKFNFLTVLYFDKYNSTKDSKWVCKCDCGNLTVQRITNLRSGKVKSCGCYRNNRLKGKPSFNSLPKGEASLNSLYISYKNRAKKKGLVFSLSKEEFQKLTQKACFYCGETPNYKHKPKDYSSEYVYNGLDRVNNSKGYTIDNIVSCCSICNRAKGTLTQKEFSNWANKLFSNLNDNKKST